MNSTNELVTSGSVSGIVLKRDKRGRLWLSAEQRKQMLSEYDRSGIGAAEFAKCYGIKYSTLLGWLQRRREGNASQGKETDRTQWLEAVVGGLGHARSAGGVVIQLAGGIRVEVGNTAAAVAMLKGLGVKTC